MTEALRPSRDGFSFLFLSLALAWAITLAWLLLSEPGDLGMSRTPDYILNVGHAVIFALLGGLLYLGFPKGHAFILLCFLLTGGYGALMELLQIWVPGRIGDPIDAMTNVLGGAWGISTLSALGTLRENGAGSVRVLLIPLWLLLASLASALWATLS